MSDHRAGSSERRKWLIRFGGMYALALVMNLVRQYVLGDFDTLRDFTEPLQIAVAVAAWYCFYRAFREPIKRFFSRSKDAAGRAASEGRSGFKGMLGRK